MKRLHIVLIAIVFLAALAGWIIFAPDTAHTPADPTEISYERTTDNMAALAQDDVSDLQERNGAIEETIGAENTESAVSVADPQDIGPVFGLAMHGEPKYGVNDTLSYVNPDAPKGGRIRLHAIGTFDNINPYILRGAPVAGGSMVFDTLLYNTQDEPFSEYGLIAESFEMPADRSSVTFNLRPEARFHDGQSITADDVIWTFNTLKEQGHPFYRAYYANVSEAVKESDLRVRFDFDVAGNRELPLIMGQMPVLPSHIWENRAFDQTTLEPIMGSGPYKVAEVSPGRRIVYERVEDYWAQDLPMMQGRHNFDRISFDYYRDDTVALQAFLAGEYDFRHENTARLWQSGYNQRLINQERIIMLEQPHSLPAGMQGYVFNTRRDVFQDKAVRQAINYAFDFEWSNRQFAYGTYERTNSYVENSELASSGLPEGRELEILSLYRDQLPSELFTDVYEVPTTTGDRQDYRSNLRRGIQILQDAGWELRDGLREKDGVRLDFEILLNNNAFVRWTAPFIKNLQRMGINANIRVVDTSQYQNRMDGFDFDMTVSTFGQSNSPGNEQRDFWHSANANENGSRNIIGVQDPVVDALIEMVIQAPNRDELVYRTRALDRVLLWGHYVVPHWHIDYFRLAYWNRFGKPDTPPAFGIGVVDTWWEEVDSLPRFPLENNRISQ